MKKFKSKVKLYVKISDFEVVAFEKTFSITSENIESATTAIFGMVKNPLNVFDDVEIEDYVIENFSKNSKLLCEVKEVKKHV